MIYRKSLKKEGSNRERFFPSNNDNQIIRPLLNTQSSGTPAGTPINNNI